MSEVTELLPCPCGGPDCEGDNLSHHCGGPREACGAPGCPECRAPSPDTAQLLARVAELEAALRGVFEWKEEISADLRLHTNPDPILDAVERALSGTAYTRAPSPETEQLRKRVAELEAALQVMVDVFQPSGEPSETGYIETRAHDNATAALSGTAFTLDTLIADAVQREREACIAACDERMKAHQRAADAAVNLPDEEEAYTRAGEAADCAAAIRARTNQPTNQPTQRNEMK